MLFVAPSFRNNKSVTDLKEKAEDFNSFFVRQYYLIKNDSKLSPRLHFLTDNRLSTAKFVNIDMLKIRQNLFQLKLMIMIRSIWQMEYFHLTGKKVTYYPSTKKNDKQYL